MGLTLLGAGTMSEPVVVVTPPASVVGECPGAPARPLAEGIPACDFIKPDPELTLAERRTYLLEELEQWLTGRICQDPAFDDWNEEKVNRALWKGTWPAARMAVILRVLTADTSVVLPDTLADRFQYVGKWAFGVCKDFLQGTLLDTSNPAALLAVGFVTIDKLSSGGTIEGLWNKSPFAPLRSALPLSPDDDDDLETDSDSYYDSDSDYEYDSEEEEEEEVEVEVDIIHRVGPSIDDKINEFLTTDYTFTIPGWLMVAAGSMFTMYMWLGVAACYSTH